MKTKHLLAILAIVLLRAAPPAHAAPGDLDTTFGIGGKVTTPIGSREDFGASVTVQSDGKIVVAGQTVNASGNFDFSLARYNADGSLDTTLNGTGKVITPLGSEDDLPRQFGRWRDDYAQNVAVQTDGRILVAGISQGGGETDFALVRYNTDGSLDTSFNGTGKVITPVGTSDARCYSVVVQADGKIVAAGESSDSFAPKFTLVRYQDDGSLDTSFNGTGKVTTQFDGRTFSIGKSVAVQVDGKIVLVGLTVAAATDQYDVAVARYNVDGILDASFGTEGQVTTDFGGNRNEGRSVALQADGKIVVAAWIFSIRDFALVRYNANGSLDTSFGGTGKITTPIGSGYDEAVSVVLQADGKIVLAGYCDSGSSDFALARYEAGPPPPLANWRQAYYGTMLNYGNAADTATPDGDAIYNLLKYGLVIMPGTSGANALPQGQRRTYTEGQRLALVFTHDPTRYDVTLEVQASDTPGGPWVTVASSILGATFSGPGFVSETPAGGGLNTVEVRDIVNLADAPLRLMRIKVTH